MSLDKVVIQVILMNLKAKAQQAQGQMPVNRNATGPTVLLPETGVDELAVFGGQTQILVTKIMSQKNHKTRGASPGSSAASSPSAISEESHTHSDPAPEVHPSLVEYLSMLPPPSLPSPKNRAGSVPTPFSFDPNSMFQPDTFAGVMPTVPPGSSAQQAYMSTSSANLDEQFLRNFNDINFFGSSQSIDPAEASNFDLMISGDAGMDERWATLMQDVLNPPNV